MRQPRSHSRVDRESVEREKVGYFNVPPRPPPHNYVCVFVRSRYAIDTE